jgi:hypothetical protein
MASVCKRHASVGLVPAGQQLSGYRQLSSINYYGPPMAYVFSHPIGTPEIRLNSSRQNDLLWASCTAKIITKIRDYWRGVAAQLLPRRDKPDGSNPAWLCCLLLPRRDKPDGSNPAWLCC